MTKILGFGDSLTAGTPGYEPGYGGDVRSQYGFWILESGRKEGISTIHFHNQGRPGELATQMLPRLKRLLNKEMYDFAIILAGTNDLGWGHHPAMVYETLQKLWWECLYTDITTIACTIPPIGTYLPEHLEKQKELNDMIMGTEMSVNDFHSCDIFSELAASNGVLLPQYDSGDGLHLSVEGYRRIGEHLWDDVIRNLIR